MPDLALSAVSKDGGLSVRAAATTSLCDQARRIHGCSPTATAALGRALTAAALMGSRLKGNQTVLLQWRGHGPLGSVVAEGRADLAARGYVGDPFADVPSRSGKIDVAGGVGNRGTLVVVKDLGLKEPYVSNVPLQTGEMADDLAYYLLHSEQVPSAVGLGVHVAADYSVSAAGGILVQALAGGDPKELDRVSDNMSRLKSVSSVVAAAGAEGLVCRALEGLEFRIQELGAPVFRCSCGPDRLDAAITALGPGEAEALLAEKGEIRVRCAFCATEWRKRSPDQDWEQVS